MKWLHIAGKAGFPCHPTTDEAMGGQFLSRYSLLPFILFGLLLLPVAYTYGGGDTVDFGFDTADMSCGDWQPPDIPYGEHALNEALGLNADPATAMQQLQQAEQEAVQDAMTANNYAATVAAAFQNQASTSIQTASNLAAATEAAGVQEVLIAFASALADLASVTDFLQNIVEGDFSDSALLEKLDSIYEAAKDGESLVNNILDRIGPVPGGTSPINDAFGTMGVANNYWGTEGVTDINSLKSDFSDITGIIQDINEYRKTGKFDLKNPKDVRKLRKVGQLVFRIAKGFAEKDLKERKQHIANLQKDLAVEQCTASKLSKELQQANEVKWQAMDRLDAIRLAKKERIGAHPEGLAGGATVIGTEKIGHVSPVELITARCPACQDIADDINQAAQAMYVAQQQIDGIKARQGKARQGALEAKKTKLQQLENELAAHDSVTATARKGLKSTDVPVLGPAKEIQDAVNAREMERHQKVNEITRLKSEIAIEEGDPAEEVETLKSARRTLLERLRELRDALKVCEEANCKTVVEGYRPVTEASAFGSFFAGFFAAEIDDLGITNGGFGSDQDVTIYGGMVVGKINMPFGSLVFRAWEAKGEADRQASQIGVDSASRILIQGNGDTQSLPALLNLTYARQESEYQAVGGEIKLNFRGWGYGGWSHSPNGAESRPMYPNYSTATSTEPITAGDMGFAAQALRKQLERGNRLKLVPFISTGFTRISHDEEFLLRYDTINFFIKDKRETDTDRASLGLGVDISAMVANAVTAYLRANANANLGFAHGNAEYGSAQTGVFNDFIGVHRSQTKVTGSGGMEGGLVIKLTDRISVDVNAFFQREPIWEITPHVGREFSLDSEMHSIGGGGIGFELIW